MMWCFTFCLFFIFVDMFPLMMILQCLLQVFFLVLFIIVYKWNVSNIFIIRGPIFLFTSNYTQKRVINSNSNIKID